MWCKEFLYGKWVFSNSHVQASTWKANGDMTKARRYKRCSIGCSIASFAFVAFLLLAVASAWIGVFCGLFQIC